MASLVETGAVGAVLTTAAAVSFGAAFFSALFGVLGSIYYSRAVSKRSVLGTSAEVQAKANIVRAGMLLVLAGGLLALSAGYLAALYKVGTVEVTAHDLKVSIHNWTYFAGAGGFHVALAVILSTLFRFTGSGSIVALIMFFTFSMVCYGAGQLQGYAYKRMLVAAYAFISHLVCVFILWWGSDKSKSPVFYSLRGWASLIPLAVAAVMYMIFFSVGSPNESSNHATLDSRSGSILAFFLGCDIPMFLACLMAVIFYLPPGAPDRVNAYDAVVGRRQAMTEEGDALTRLDADQ